MEWAIIQAADQVLGSPMNFQVLGCFQVADTKTKWHEGTKRSGMR